MKKRRIIYILLIVACLLAYRGYRILDRIRTDTRAPEIVIPVESLQLSVSDGDDALLQGITAADNVDGDVTDSLVVERMWMTDTAGVFNVRYAAFDRSGNVAKAERQVRYTDYEGPRFALTSPLVYKQNYTYDVLQVIRAEDMLDGDISHRIRATSLDNQSMMLPGVHDVQFRVYNSLGDSVELVLPVEVIESETHQAELTLSDYLIYLDAGDRFEARRYLDSFVWGGKTTSLANGLPANYTLKTTSDVDTEVPGVYAVTYQVTYTAGYGSQVITGGSKLIVVVEG